ncbi:hypothetical protein WJ0W_001964 [Paenibacillus melissococcoides]|uniref:Uncharacterized protein n=1 Tax=Paenibacillus melissococcoides TaxID=2912268 RepID=A0ABM9G081_9BACL|nr:MULTISPECIES: hypothetical protein [Paenibacillus]MEB9892835.1 hypothetical protein [Bacillus cereus]CAH8244734.1 hypothetical protein WJ0W_001964 [Paenibacillus melissococcoides]CAH8709566.1 hypothetical protein HTL2_002333 [Paenibacillus melissococcoides]
MAAAILLAGWGVFYVYDHYFNEAGILDRVMRQSGYALMEKEKPVSVALKVRPEWIPAQEEAESSKLRIELAKKNETTFVLASVWHRGKDIYFDFEAVPEMHYSGGEFLHNTFVIDGSYRDFSPDIPFRIINADGKAVAYGGSGYGPGASFGFAIDADKYDQIKDGFTVEYQGLIRYEYVKM